MEFAITHNAWRYSCDAEGMNQQCNKSEGSGTKRVNSMAGVTALRRTHAIFWRSALYDFSVINYKHI